MPYRVVFDVADRLPLVALGVAALVILATVGVLAIRRIDALIVRWPVILFAGAGLFALEVIVDKRPLFLIGPLWVAAIATGIELSDRRSSEADRRSPPAGVAATIVGTFLLVFAVGFGLPMIAAVGLSRQLAQGHAEVIEGPVSITFEVSAGKNECIAVFGREFCYSDWLVTPSFNRTRALGGPMREGLQVRISSIGDTIVRVEVAEAP